MNMDKSSLIKKKRKIQQMKKLIHKFDIKTDNS